MLAAPTVRMSGNEQKSEQEHIQHFLHKTGNQEVFGSHVVVVQNNGKAMYNKSVQSYFFANQKKKCAARQDSEKKKKHSNETALIKIIDELLFKLDKDRVSGMVLVDYRKAFDMVDHEFLLRKLNVYGVANQKLNWCRSYLCSRKQVVHVRGKESGEAM